MSDATDQPIDDGADEKAIADVEIWTPPRRLYEPLEEKARPAIWLTSFCDLLGVCLTFFLMLYAMSSPREEQWNKMAQSLQQGLNTFSSQRAFKGPEDAMQMQAQANGRGLNLAYLKNVLQETKQKESGLTAMRLLPDGDTLRIILPSDLLFDATSDAILPAGKKALYVLGNVLNRIRNRIEIHGYTDQRAVPPGTSFTNNWDLSLARAASVAGFLKSIGYAKPLGIQAFPVENWEQGVASGLDSEKLMALSRRVDIVIMPDDGTSRSQLQLIN